eukprot:16471-Heterococcus_DN1.PRE.1
MHAACNAVLALAAYTASYRHCTWSSKRTPAMLHNRVMSVDMPEPSSAAHTNCEMQCTQLNRRHAY